MVPETDERYRLKDHLLLRVFEDGGVVFDLDSRVCHEINRTAGRMLQYLNGEYELDTVAEILAAEFDAPSHAVEKDLRGFISDLIERGWIDVPE